MSNPLPPANPPDGVPQIHQNTTGDHNQVIGQVSGGVVINHLTIHERIPEPSLPPLVSETRPLTQPEYRQRKVLLNKVKDYWVTGVLKTSLHARALIDLGLQERPDLMQRPFSGVEEFAEVPGQLLPDGTVAATIFEKMGEGRTLLILGEPGSGKTITLLKLAEDLISRTEKDLSQPIPVVFNLSSWAKKPQAIEKWLVQELLEKYQVSKALGKQWVQTESLILLLDGLDEVKAKQRNACVQALNQFMQTYGAAELIICCRIQDYQALASRLKLRNAICIQPLKSNQIAQYCEQGGKRLESLKTMLREDEVLHGLATSPLMLSIMSLAYQDSNPEDIIRGGTTKDYRQRLFNIYVDRMFQRRCTSQRYSPQQSKRWLIWLAQYMTRNAQSVFLIEKLQPDALITYWLKMSHRLLNGLVVGLLSFPRFMLPGFLTTGLIFIYLHQANVERGKSYELTSTFFLWANILAAISISILINFFKKDKKLVIQPIESINWNWGQAGQHFVDALKGLISTFFRDDRGCVGGCWFLVLFGPIAIPIWLICLLVSTLNKGLYISKLELKTLANQGILESRKNSLLGIVIGFMIGEIIILMINAWIDWMIVVYRLRFIPSEVYFPDFLFNQSTIAQFSTLIFIFLSGWLGWLNYGGLACTQHLILRVVLAWNRFIPWDYSAFLDYAADRLFLQKVGGGYIFVHRMLLEHFAAMPLEEEKR